MGTPTLDGFKTYKSISSTNDTEDNMLEPVLNSSMVFIENYCGRQLFSEDEISQYADGLESKIFLDNYPVIDISVGFSADGGQSYTNGVKYTDYFVGGDYILLNNYVQQGITHNAIRILYTAGSESIPADLEQSVYDLTEHFRKTEYNPKSSLGTNMVERTNKDTDVSKLPDHIIRVLNNYRNLV